MSAGTLYLIPVPLGAQADPLLALAPAAVTVARGLQRFFVEHPKSARGFLKRMDHPLPLQSLVMIPIGRHQAGQDLRGLLQPLLQGEDAGVLSEAGCPAVADPGADLVRAAHESGITVMPMVGPSSLLLALMASGLNGQRFGFQGYLPVEQARRDPRIRQVEMRSRNECSTQIFIETPYRNDSLLEALLEHCAADTLLCVAVDLGEPGQTVITRSIAGWRATDWRPGKRPAVFLLLARVAVKTSALKTRPAR